VDPLPKAHPAPMDTALTAPPATPKADSGSTHFVFQHKVFNVPKSYFAPASDTGEALFHVMLGTIQGAMTIDALRAEFGIKPDSSDSKLLGIIERSLRFLKRIRPGDSIPREILDGTASWSVEDRHREIANSRLSYQLATWIGGEESVVADAEQLRKLADDPAVKARIVESFGSAAEKLGLGKDKKQEVVDRIDTLANELAYIEALRERFGAIRAIVEKLAACVKLYNRDRQTAGEISRMQTLIREPILEFEKIFKSIYVETAEILPLLQNLAARVEAIRRARDELHARFMQWDEIIALWDDLQLVRGDYHYVVFKKTYQFLAQKYRPSTDWNGLE
jgi:hypothetical protein